MQRSVITLNHLKVPYTIDYIDLSNKPDWFLDISPLGKVPVVQVNDGASIFESAVINEFVSEINPPVLHPKDPVDKARNRAWIEFGSGLLGNNYQMRNAKTKEEFEEKRAKLVDQLKKVEGQIGEGPFFNGEEFSLIDSSYAPVFLQLSLINAKHDTDVYAETPKVARWAEVVLSMPEVKTSVVEDFADLFYASMGKSGSYLAQFV
ncbi:MAG: glutathione S-transferase family protein [Anaerolineae bacterium]